MEYTRYNIKRLEWLDICRGILIVFMVIGHSTGLFNKYIYQFHMAAFFFLSGYMSHPEKRSFIRTFFDKFFSVLLPAIVTVLFGLIVLWLLHLGNYDITLSAWEFPGWSQALRTFFLRGDIYVDVLGANWFLITLFGVCILNRFIYLLTYKSPTYHMLICAGLYIIGYVMVDMGHIPHIGMFPLDLVLIGNFFYALGYYFQSINILEWIAGNRNIWMSCIIISVICMWMISHYLHIAIDWPSRSFSHLLLDGISALNGILFVYGLSLFISRFFSKIGKALCFIGKNTMGILFFHFTFFKVMYFPFYLGGLITKADFSCLIPGTMSSPILEEKYWFIIAAGAIALSLTTWRLMMRNQMAVFLLGQSKQRYIDIWNVLINTEIANSLVATKKELMHKAIKAKQQVAKIYKKNQCLCLSVALLLLLVAIPLYKQKIMCNDELQTRLWSMKGFTQFFKHYAIEDYVAKGRALSAIVDPLSMYLGFLGNGNWTFRILQILSILLDAGMFSLFLFKLLKNRRFAITCGLSAVVFLPITFEHTAPNAFNTLFNIPFAFLLLSFVFFINYLETGRKRALLASLVLLFINLVSYESFVMLIPVYWGIALWKIGIKKQTIRKSLYPTATALLFIICYIIFGNLFKSSYSGNLLGGFSVKSSIKIIMQLAQASFPGYYLFSPKYRYLFAYYNNIDTESFVRIFLVSIVYGCIIYFLAKDKKAVSMERKKFLGFLFMGLSCVILPTFPIAVAKMYQGNVGPDAFMALPTSFFTYFAATFVCWFIIWHLIQTFRNKTLALFMAISVACYVLPVQAMNDVFAEQQKLDFQRLLTMESLFSTELMKLFDGYEIKSTDLFVTKNALAVHAPYWTEFASLRGRDIQISQEAETSGDICLYFDENQFTIRNKDEICVVTTSLNTGFGICRYAKEKCSVINYVNPIEDNGLYIYFYELSDAGLLTSSNKDNFAQKLIGDSLQNCLKEYGYYGDGWVAKNSQFQIRTGDEGILDIDIYCPLEDFHDKKIYLYVNDILTEAIELQEPTKTINVNTAPNQIITLRMETNFVQENTGGDMREMTMIISSMQGR
ncbi:acyltransferase family protein [uncultured Acetatifactor sp.]|jgi:fucose 4-O-acetylase-like acetyltransferase|uniref:acyltransferase family protein n=1 Tax=uncultured Acetatifactor sp. TaxID=1671927 RepID=UPI00260E58FD|nr:acyltransferase family protein [uncultured Acetatifactor sp.]